MFTGLIEELGRVRSVQPRGQLQRLEVAASRVVADLRTGDSISIDGACQTAVTVATDGFAVESVPETLQRTTLGQLRPGQPLNLERALAVGQRLGGHMVLGHVDGVGRIQTLRDLGSSWELAVQLPAELEPYVAGKGSIAVDGISLTVVEAAAGRFTVAVIPHTFENTALRERRPGDAVNLEVDVVARYVERLLRGGADTGLTWETLRQQGY